MRAHLPWNVAHGRAVKDHWGDSSPLGGARCAESLSTQRHGRKRRLPLKKCTKMKTSARIFFIALSCDGKVTMARRVQDPVLG